MKNIQDLKVTIGNWWRKHSVIQLLKVLVIALIGGYLLQCISNVIAPLIIFEKILPELLMPNWRTLLLALYVLDIALPAFNVVDKISWLKLTFILCTILASAVVLWLVATYARILI